MAARYFGRRARKIDYLISGALIPLRAASSLVGAIDPVLGAPVTAGGALILGGVALSRHVKTRMRGDLPRKGGPIR